MAEAGPDAAAPAETMELGDEKWILVRPLSRDESRAASVKAQGPFSSNGVAFEAEGRIVTRPDTKAVVKKLLLKRQVLGKRPLSVCIKDVVEKVKELQAAEGKRLVDCWIPVGPNPLSWPGPDKKPYRYTLLSSGHFYHAGSALPDGYVLTEEAYSDRGLGRLDEEAQIEWATLNVETEVLMGLSFLVDGADLAYWPLPLVRRTTFSDNEKRSMCRDIVLAKDSVGLDSPAEYDELGKTERGAFVLFLNPETCVAVELEELNNLLTFQDLFSVGRVLAVDTCARLMWVEMMDSKLSKAKKGPAGTVLRLSVCFEVIFDIAPATATGKEDFALFGSLKSELRKQERGRPSASAAARLAKGHSGSLERQISRTSVASAASGTSETTASVGGGDGSAAGTPHKSGRGKGKGKAKASKEKTPKKSKKELTREAERERVEKEATTPGAVVGGDANQGLLRGAAREPGAGAQLVQGEQFFQVAQRLSSLQAAVDSHSLQMAGTLRTLSGEVKQVTRTNQEELEVGLARLDRGQQAFQASVLSALEEFKAQLLRQPHPQPQPQLNGNAAQPIQAVGIDVEMLGAAVQAGLCSEQSREYLHELFMASVREALKAEPGLFSTAGRRKSREDARAKANCIQEDDWLPEEQLMKDNLQRLLDQGVVEPLFLQRFMTTQVSFKKAKLGDVSVDPPLQAEDLKAYANYYLTWSASRPFELEVWLPWFEKQGMGVSRLSHWIRSTIRASQNAEVKRVVRAAYKEYEDPIIDLDREQGVPVPEQTSKDWELYIQSVQDRFSEEQKEYLRGVEDNAQVHQMLNMWLIKATIHQMHRNVFTVSHIKKTYVKGGALAKELINTPANPNEALIETWCSALKNASVEQSVGGRHSSLGRHLFFFGVIFSHRIDFNDEHWRRMDLADSLHEVRRWLEQQRRLKEEDDVSDASSAVSAEGTRKGKKSPKSTTKSTTKSPSARSAPTPSPMSSARSSPVKKLKKKRAKSPESSDGEESEGTQSSPDEVGSGDEDGVDGGGEEEQEQRKKAAKKAMLPPKAPAPRRVSSPAGRPEPRVVHTQSGIKKPPPKSCLKPGPATKLDAAVRARLEQNAARKRAGQPNSPTSPVPAKKTTVSLVDDGIDMANIPSSSTAPPPAFPSLNDSSEGQDFAAE